MCDVRWKKWIPKAAILRDKDPEAVLFVIIESPDIEWPASYLSQALLI
jgi:hypothetical protein